MPPITATSASLLEGLRDLGNEQVWSEFCARYAPLLQSFGKRLGLSEHDAEDAAQDTLAAFADSYRKGQYEPGKGRLRTWLLGIATHKIREIQRQRGRARVLGEQDLNTGFLNAIPDDDDAVSEAWEAEWQDAVIRACVDKVREEVAPTTIQAFELFALQRWSAEKVAAHLNISRNTVFLSKSRVLARVRELRAHMEEIW